MAMTPRRKITTGLNDRPLDESIGQTGDGLPDDSGRSLETDDRQIERARASLTGRRAEAQSPFGSGGGTSQTVPERTPEADENICRRCAGSGTVEGVPCPDCGGSGEIIPPLGGG
jgi:hypothetical protein